MVGFGTDDDQALYERRLVGARRRAVSHLAWYPTWRGIPLIVVSHFAWYPTSRGVAAAVCTCVCDAGVSCTGGSSWLTYAPCADALACINIVRACVCACVCAHFCGSVCVCLCASAPPDAGADLARVSWVDRIEHHELLALYAAPSSVPP